MWPAPLSMQAIEAVLLHSSKGRFSSHILAEAIIKFYETKKLFPAGIVKSMDCIQKWSIRMGRALQRVVPLSGYILSCFFDFVKSYRPESVLRNP